MKKTENTIKIQNVNESKAVRELLARQAEISRQLAEVEKLIDAERKNETLEAQTQRALDGLEITSTLLPELINKRSVLNNASQAIAGQIKAARCTASVEIVKEHRAAIDATRTATARAAIALRDAIVEERVHEKKLRAAGCFVEDLFPKPAGWFQLLPDGAETGGEALLNNIIKLRGL